MIRFETTSVSIQGPTPEKPRRKIPRRKKPRQRGFTLIELLLVLTLLASLLGAIVGMMSIASTSSKQATKNLLTRQQIRRFADDVRRDVRMAKDVELVEGKLILSAENPDRRTLYSVDAGSTIRRDVEDSIAQVPLSDRYALDESMTIEVKKMDEINAVRWTLTERDRPDQPIQILAARGWNP